MTKRLTNKIYLIIKNKKANFAIQISIDKLLIIDKNGVWA